MEIFSIYATQQEKANIYVGLAMGALIPIAAGRYLMFPSSFEGELPILAEATAWTASTIVNGGIILCADITSWSYDAVVKSSRLVGWMDAEMLRNKRLEERRNLERTIINNYLENCKGGR